MTGTSRLPSLKALKAFEAAGRLGSFLAAAEELSVTPGAISRQIKTLEESLDIQLFTRGHREVKLTEDANRYREALSEAFRNIQSATDILVDEKNKRPVRVMCSVNIAVRWLFPRLPRFHMDHPGNDVTITTLPNPQIRSLKFGEADLVIRMGNPEWLSTQNAVFLFPSELICVCSPRLMENGEGIQTLEDIHKHRLLVSELRTESWANWLRAGGASAPDPSMFHRYESSAMSCAAAVEGLGLALSERALVNEEIRSGRLLSPLEHSFRSDEGFYLLLARKSSAQVTPLVKWLKEEGVKTTKAMEMNVNYE